jgi:hypothetical protein
MEVALLSPSTPRTRMPKLKTLDEPQQVSAEYRELLAEFVRMFEAMPQKYCLFCEATSSLGTEAHKPECPYCRATKLLGEQAPSP